MFPTLNLCVSRPGAGRRPHPGATCTLQAIGDINGGVQLTWLIAVECEGSDKPALVAEWLGRLYF